MTHLIADPVAAEIEAYEIDAQFDALYQAQPTEQVHTLSDEDYAEVARPSRTMSQRAAHRQDCARYHIYDED